MPDRRTLVVGTTPDYIGYIHSRYPGRALFITDRSQRLADFEVMPDSASEIVCDLTDTEQVKTALIDHMRQHNQFLAGVTCYDCEWLSLAAELAGQFRLPFPTHEAVHLSRNKYRTKMAWRKAGVRCPQTELIASDRQAIQFFEHLGHPVVMKPLSGSGSELTFKCATNHEAAHAFRLLRTGLAERTDLPMYHLDRDNGCDGDSQPILIEEFIEGREYSCDFILEKDEVTIIRVAKKLRAEGMPFGTTFAYIVPARLPGQLDEQILREKLHGAARALGFSRAVCMVDFMISHDEIIFLEMTPRIGGDCLPPLIRQSCGLDTIGLALDFAEGRQVAMPPLVEWTPLIGLRLFAEHDGILTRQDVSAVNDDPRVREVYLKRSDGHEIWLPPEDYDSWMLGHVIFEPGPHEDIGRQCEEIRSKCITEVEINYDRTNARLDASGRPVIRSTDSAA